MTDLRKARISQAAVAQVRDLAQANLDSFTVLTEASACMNDPVTSEILREIAERREQNAEQLKSHISNDDDEELPDTTSLCGKLHQIWIDCRSAINVGDTYVMLVEAEKAEKAIQSTYQDAIKHLSRSTLQTAVTEQLRIITEDSAKISELRENLKRVRTSYASPEEHP